MNTRLSSRQNEKKICVLYITMEYTVGVGECDLSKSKDQFWDLLHFYLLVTNHIGLRCFSCNLQVGWNVHIWKSLLSCWKFIGNLYVTQLRPFFDQVPRLTCDHNYVWSSPYVWSQSQFLLKHSFQIYYHWEKFFYT